MIGAVSLHLESGHSSNPEKGLSIVFDCCGTAVAGEDGAA
jgi:hypothetical protein